MNFRNEKQLLYIIRYSLPITILLLSAVIISFLYFQNKANFEKIKIDAEAKLLENKKQLIKEHIDGIYDYITEEQKDTEENLKKLLLNRVNKAHETILDIYNQFKHTYTKEEIVEIIKTSLRSATFNNTKRYFFINDKNGINILHPLMPHIEGTSTLNFQDVKGLYVTKESLKLLEKNESSFLQWYWRKDKLDLKQYRKLGYVKNVEIFNWYIGTGEYTDDFKIDLQSKFLNQIKKLKLGEEGYTFAFDEKNNILTPLQKNEIDLNNKKNLKIIKSIAKNGGGYILENTNQITYVRMIPNWNWFIGMSFNKNEIQSLIDREKEMIEEEYKNSLRNVLIFCIILSTVFLILSLYVSKNIEKKFKRYKSDIKKQINKNEKQHDLLAQKTKLAAMGEMMENVAHQWRQPLSMITISATGVILQKDMGNLNDKFLRESLENINTSAKYLSDTIEDFRDFFKPNKEKTLFKISETLDKSLRLLSSQFKNKEIEIIKNIKEVEVQGYQRELLQVLLNILNNAKDALNEIDSNKFIFIDVYSRKNIVNIHIKDTAGGIPQDVIKRVFEPYFTTKHKSQGTGIGLYMSQEIITRHMNGELKVQNEEFEYENEKYTGAVFTIQVPIKH